MRAIRCLLAAALAAGIVTVVAAQPGGGFGGFGGFGGGDVTTLVLTNAALQEEVKVTDAQKTKFKDIAAKQGEMTKKMRDGLKEKFADAQGDKEKMTELFAGMQKENAKITADMRKMLDAELTADQKKRLKQIGIQQMGVAVFGEPVEGKGGFGGTTDAQKAMMKEVADALKFTDAQKSKIKGMMEEYTKDVTSLRNDIFGEQKGGFGGIDKEKMTEFTSKNDKLSSELKGRIAETLDDTQKAKWKDLVGEPFDLTKLRPTFGKKD